jgi:hypothetical protein
VLEDIKRKKMLCHALLIDGTPLEVADDILTVGLRSAYAFHMENLNRQENRDIVEAALARVLSKPLRFKCLLYDVPQATSLAGASAAGASSAGGAQAVAPEAAAPEESAAAGPGPATAASDTPGGELSFVERARRLFGADIVDEWPAS